MNNSYIPQITDTIEGIHFAIDLGKGQETHVIYVEDIIINKVWYDKETRRYECIFTKAIKPKTIPEQVFEMRRDGEYIATIKIKEAEMQQQFWWEILMHHALMDNPGIRKYTTSVFEITHPIVV